MKSVKRFLEAFGASILIIMCSLIIGIAVHFLVEAFPVVMAIITLLLVFLFGWIITKK